MGDDMIATGSTLIAAVEALKDAGATSVTVFATHGHFAGNAFEKHPLVRAECVFAVALHVQESDLPPRNFHGDNNFFACP